MMMRVSTTPPTPVSAGRYDDVYVKTPAGWRIKRRNHPRGPVRREARAVASGT